MHRFPVWPNLNRLQPASCTSHEFVGELSIPSETDIFQLSRDCCDLETSAFDLRTLP